MRAELAIALLHDPDIVYLDEPTIGLDVVAKSRMRKFIREVNRERNTTVILTTHDMDDIDQVCSRIIMIDKGKLLYDGLLQNFKYEYGNECLVSAVFTDENILLTDNRLRIVKEEGPKKDIIFDKKEISAGEAVTYLTRSFNISDLNIKEPDIEDIVRNIYETGSLTDKENLYTSIIG
jgi:ABC-2 type transport system ATP-binding protein